jgi:mannose-6-phosphate isomerase-like protein (cupin superfamily)
MTVSPAASAVGPGEGQRFILPTRGHGTVKLGAVDTGGSLSALELVCEPGQGPAVHVHSREHEIWYVLDGEFVFLLDTTLTHLSTGGLAFGPISVPHTFQNIGMTTGRLLVITGPAGLEEFFLDYDRRASGPYDTSALAQAARIGGIDFVGPPATGLSPTHLTAQRFRQIRHDRRVRKDWSDKRPEPPQPSDRHPGHSLSTGRPARRAVRA